MRHLVFVYGTLKRGGGNNRLLESARLVGPAVTVEAYGMDAAGSPRVYREAPRGFAAPIVGEVYCVDDETLARLDSLERHPDWYCREQVSVDGPDGSVTAWLYFMPVTHKAAAHDLFARPVYVNGDARHVWGMRHAAALESEEERRAVVSALRVYRNRLRMAARANLRRQWTPAPGQIDLNLAKLRVVNALLRRWQLDGDAASAPRDGDAASPAAGNSC